MQNTDNAETTLRGLISVLWITIIILNDSDPDTICLLRFEIEAEFFDTTNVRNKNVLVERKTSGKLE